jgi:hypothetical protein
MNYDAIENRLSNLIGDNTVNYYKFESQDHMIFYCLDLMKQYHKRLDEIRLLISDQDPSSTIVISEYAGLGDTIHTRLALQHLDKIDNSRLVWITPNLVADLYKDDNLCLNFGNDVYNPFRNPNIRFCRFFSSYMSSILDFVFSDHTCIDVTNKILHSHNNFKKRRIGFANHAFAALGVAKDEHMHHYINHEGCVDLNNTKPIVCIETTRHESSANVKKYTDIITNLSRVYDVIIIGGTQDATKYKNLFMDCRGWSLYDTLSVMKKASLFIGRNSSNTTLMAFIDDIHMLIVDGPTVGLNYFKAFKENRIKPMSNVGDISKFAIRYLR